ncbi:MAG: fused MFS/spermidine synthase [Anaerolineaceae bacterium]
MESNLSVEQGQHIPATPSLPKWYLNLTIFVAGMTTMAVEFGASRLLGNVFGTSNIVWAVIIGLVLVYLTLGNWLGGKLADKSPTYRAYFSVLAWAGFFVGVVPLIARPILRVSANAFDALQIPVLAGSFLAVLILFSVPVILLGMVTPFALKLLIQDTHETGRVSGRMSAISTLGSFVGTFLTVLVLIPFVGTYRTFIVTSLLLLVIALPGLWRTGGGKRFVLFVLLTLAVVIMGILGIRGTDKSTEGLIFESESAYNYIQVLQSGDFRFLRLNEGQGMHSIYHPSQLFYRGPWSQALVAPYFNPPGSVGTKVDNIAILGLAAGTTARQANTVYPEARVDGFEIDPEIIQVGKDWFGMDLPNLTTYAEDARWGIAHSNNTYNIISVDAYRPPYIPAHMVTVEFFQIVYSKLEESGVMVINVGRSSTDRTLVDTISGTVAQVFPKVYAMDLPDSYNTILFATKNTDTGWDYFAQNMGTIEAIQPDSLLSQAMNLTMEGKAEVGTSTMIFTDDKAPIEFMTNRLVLDFVFQDLLE